MAKPPTVAPRQIQKGRPLGESLVMKSPKFRSSDASLVRLPAGGGNDMGFLLVGDGVSHPAAWLLSRRSASRNHRRVFSGTRGEGSTNPASDKLLTGCRNNTATKLRVQSYCIGVYNYRIEPSKWGFHPPALT